MSITVIVPSIFSYYINTVTVLFLIHNFNFWGCQSSYLFSPDFKWRPSTFWLTMYFSKPFSTSLVSDRWVKVGRASSKWTSTSSFCPFFSNVHTPLGPRKSGIPVEKELLKEVYSPCSKIKFRLNLKRTKIYKTR